MKRDALAIAVVGGSLLLLAPPGKADEVTVEMHEINARGVWDVIGTVKATDTADGLALTIALKDLPGGAHGFHLHENGSCGPGEGAAGMAAGGHYDPNGTGRHMGPSARGHLGDLPVIFIQTDEDGGMPYRGALFAPHLKVSDMRGRTLVIHTDGDNFADEPKPNGGGGERLACGLVAN